MSPYKSKDVPSNIQERSKINGVAVVQKNRQPASALYYVVVAIPKSSPDVTYLPLSVITHRKSLNKQKPNRSSGSPWSSP
jgi:hypothetical protein